MKEELLFVSANKQKLKEARQILAHLEVEVVCQRFPFQELLSDDLLFIALDKACCAYEKLKTPLIVMDTGFYIDAYPNQPGFPGPFIKNDLLEPLGLDGLLENMKEVKNRHCHFTEWLVYCDEDGPEFFKGKKNGTLAYQNYGTEEKDRWTALWGVFIPAGSSLTLSQMPEEERYQKWPHSEDALEKFATWYKTKKAREVAVKKYIK